MTAILKEISCSYWILTFLCLLHPPLPTGIAGEWVLGRMTAGILVKSRDMKRPLRRNIATWSLSAALFLGEHWSSTKLSMLHGSTGNIGK
jgi:hypothetical protein